MIDTNLPMDLEIEQSNAALKVTYIGFTLLVQTTRMIYRFQGVDNGSRPATDFYPPLLNHHVVPRPMVAGQQTHLLLAPISALAGRMQAELLQLSDNILSSERSVPIRSRTVLTSRGV